MLLALTLSAIVQKLIHRRLSMALLGAILISTSACGTLAGGRKWGEDATLWPGWERVGKAAFHAAVSPGTLAPAAGALLFQADGWDRKTTTWASRRAPVFGSRENAENASGALVIASAASYGITVLAAPAGPEPAEAAMNKLKGLGVGLAAFGLTEGTVWGLKEATHRTRPDGTDRLSFPSGDAARAAGMNTQAARNLECLDGPGWAQTGATVGLYALTASTAWSRLEAKRHYPSDVLAGMALGHFFGAFVNDAFLGVREPRWFFAVEPGRREVFLTFHKSY